MSKIIINILKLIITLLIVVAVSIYFTLNNSLATLNGEIFAATQQPVEVSRDAAGIPTIRSQSREDLSFALGYLHAQERLFQMDLLRRNSAGELSELFGPLALTHDKRIRVHQFRVRAEKYVNHLAPHHKTILTQYTAGINQGMSELGAKPLEYWLLNKTPQPWREADSLLVLYSMYIDLQYEDGDRERLLGHLNRNLMPDVFQFLTPEGSRWDAAIDDTQFSPPKLPNNTISLAPLLNDISAVNDISAEKSSDFSLFDHPHEALKGSNNWVVSGEITPHNSAIVADDMHLGLGVPNIWYRASFRYGDDEQQVAADGVTLPGVPAIVVGSNRHIAWGFTNSYGDWNDVIRLTLDESGQQYLTPDGFRHFDVETETILVGGQKPERIEIKRTIWGPVIGQDHDGSLIALRWVAHDPEGINFDLLDMEQATNLNQAIKVANGAGIPAQNIVIGDQNGDIAWTIAGVIPNKTGQVNWQLPQNWGKGHAEWQGYLDESLYPSVINPKQQRIWTANSRVVGGEMYAKIGNGGYALGARSTQIKRRLFEKQSLTEMDLFAIQNDHKAEFLAPWQNFLLTEVMTDSFVDTYDLGELKQLIENWGEAAAIDSVGYLFVREFRLAIRDALFAGLQNELNVASHKSKASLHLIRHQLEIPMWQLVNEQPPHLKPSSYPSWQSFLQQMVVNTREQLVVNYGDLSQATWGAYNTATIQHPLAKAIPALSWLLDMTPAPAAGDSYMPRVQGKSFGASQRMVVAPGQEEQGIMQMPAGQASHPLSPYFGIGHQAWLEGKPTPFLPGPEKYKLTFIPN